MITRIVLIKRHHVEANKQRVSIVLSFSALRLMVFEILLALLITACSSPTSQPTTPTLMPCGMVDVRRYELFYKCSGQGSPTVILKAGAGADSSSWAKVMSDIEKIARVYTFGRANLGSSDPTPIPRTFPDSARDLHALLVNARIGGLYTLVGHSLGELIRVLADQHPEGVAEILLIDAAHPDMGPRLLAGLPLASADEPENIEFWR